MHRLITQYFDSSLSELQTMGQYKDIASSHVQEIQQIRKKLSI